jgi:hypothetical protein
MIELCRPELNVTYNKKYTKKQRKIDSEWTEDEILHLQEFQAKRSRERKERGL